MTDTTNLHVLARRYCMQRHAMLVEKYEPIAREQSRQAQYIYAREAYDIYPRYNVLAAILDTVETLDPEHLPAFVVLVQTLSAMAWTANSIMTGGHSVEAAKRAEDDERRRFQAHVERASENEAHVTQPPLFYRRTLGPDEEAELLARLKTVWGADGGYWYPIAEKPTKQVVETFPLSETGDADLEEQFQSFFAKNGIQRIYELGEDGPGCVRDTTDQAAKFGWSERYLLSKELDWIAYASHEATLTLGGRILGSVIPA